MIIIYIIRTISLTIYFEMKISNLLIILIFSIQGYNLILLDKELKEI